MEALNRYLAELATHLPRDPALREAVLAEVEGHLRERALAWQAQGLGEEESMRRAIEQFGDADEVGEALARVHRGGTWRQALAGGLPHLLAGLAATLPALPLAWGGAYLARLGSPLLANWPPLEVAFGVLVIAVLAVWGRRPRLWTCSWVGYGLLLALGLTMTGLSAGWFGPGLGHQLVAAMLWLVVASLVYLWLARRDRLGAVLAALALVPLLWTALMLDEVQPPLASYLFLATALLTALATAAAIRLGDERRGIALLAAANAVIALPVTSVAIFCSEYPAILAGFGGRITPASVTVSMVLKIGRAHV